jgi:molybdate transport system substrate-binding protein
MLTFMFPRILKSQFLMRLSRSLPTLICVVFSAMTVHAQSPENDVTIYAASSLSEVLPAIFKSAPDGLATHTQFVFGASGALERQLKHGNQAQLFISADEETMDKAIEAKRMDGATRRSFAMNRLALVVPASAPPFDERALRSNATQSGSRGRVQSHVLLALAAPEAKLILADPEDAPLGKYARVSLQALNVWDQTVSKIQLTPDARAAVKLIEQSATSIGFVYMSDAINNPRLRIVAQVPVELHPPVFYVAATPLNATSSAKAALAFLSSEAAQKILSEYGFRPL